MREGEKDWREREKVKLRGERMREREREQEQVMGRGSEWGREVKSKRGSERQKERQ